ncbi:MAG: TatD family hydrolase [Cytophagaceae bacterium]|jgi:TatD DNase family protein|nr:TatD family hydrolase [Cytophagaceae bacterium]
MLVDIHTHQAHAHAHVQSFDIHQPLPETSWFTVGLHPWYVEASTWKANAEKLIPFLQLPHCLGLGECGLDALRGPDLSIQRAALLYQWELAKTFQLPVILHLVKSYEACWQLRHSLPGTPVLLHGFTGSVAWMRKFSELGCYFSFGASLLRLPHLKQVLEETPFDKIVLETDTAPAGTLEQLARQVAIIKGCEEAFVEQQLLSNSICFLGTNLV